MYGVNSVREIGFVSEIFGGEFIITAIFEKITPNDSICSIGRIGIIRRGVDVTKSFSRKPLEPTFQNLMSAFEWVQGLIASERTEKEIDKGFNQKIPIEKILGIFNENEKKPRELFLGIFNESEKKCPTCKGYSVILVPRWMKTEKSPEGEWRFIADLCPCCKGEK